MRFKTIGTTTRVCNKCQRVTSQNLNVKNKSVVKLHCKECKNWNKRNYSISDIPKLKRLSELLELFVSKFNTSNFRTIKSNLKKENNYTMLKCIMI